MWFKNILAYQFTNPIEFDINVLEKQLEADAFMPCKSQDVKAFGWQMALGEHGKEFTHAVGATILITAKIEEKLLPASVVNDEASEKIIKEETAQQRPLNKQEKTAIKDDVLFSLLPRAFSRFQRIHALIMPEHNLIIIDATSAKKAEELLALLRKSIGSLPVKPVETELLPSQVMTDWILKQKSPAAFTINDEAEFRSLLDEGGIIRCKQQDLYSDEIKSHLEAGKLVTKLSLSWRDQIEFILDDELSIKRIKYLEALREKNDLADRDDILANIDADLIIMSDAFAVLFNELFKLFKKDGNE